MSRMLTEIDSDLLEKTRLFREDLHRHPELSEQETRTASRVADALREIGLDSVEVGVAGTGVVGLLKGPEDGPTIALRADMDALPIREETGLPYASEIPGVMHACGHDGHTAILVAVAEVLMEHRDELPGSVKFIFQPAEEGLSGGLHMVEAGVLKAPEVDTIFALHGRNGLCPGRIGLSATPNAAVNGFSMSIRGRGGHGARPHDCVDPIAIGAQIINQSQLIVSREVRPDMPAVLSFCCFRAGSKSNIIPESAEVLGTIRATEMSVLRQVRERLEEIATGVASNLRGHAEIEDAELYPPVHNDADLLRHVERVGSELLGEANVVWDTEQRMGAEDFAFYLEDQGGVPGVIFGLGIETDANGHSPHFDFGSAGLEPGILMLANIALSFPYGD